MTSKVYHTGKRETRQQLQRINEAAMGIRNKIEMHQNIRRSMERRLAAYIRAEVGYS